MPRKYNNWENCKVGEKSKNLKKHGVFCMFLCFFMYSMYLFFKNST